MTGSVYKKFDKELFDKNDSIARSKAKEYFLSKGQEVKDNEDKYGPDLVLGSGINVELEVKHSWKGRKFPFKTVQIPERKEKFAKIGCLFVMFNSDLTSGFLIQSKDILESPKVEVSNKFVKSGEKFFQIDIDKCEQFFLT